MHLNDDDLVLHYYGEMPVAEDTRAAAHLASCGECQQHYTTLQRVMAFVDSAPAVEAAPGFERVAWARLAPALAASRRTAWISWFVFSPAHLAFAAGGGASGRAAGPGRPRGSAGGGRAARPRSRPNRCASGSCSWISATISIGRRCCWSSSCAPATARATWTSPRNGRAPSSSSP